MFHLPYISKHKSQILLGYFLSLHLTLSHIYYITSLHNAFSNVRYDQLYGLRCDLLLVHCPEYYIIT